MAKTKALISCAVTVSSSIKGAVATFWTISAHSVNCAFWYNLSIKIVISVISHFGFENRTLVLIVPVHVHYLHYNFVDSEIISV